MNKTIKYLVIFTLVSPFILGLIYSLTISFGFMDPIGNPTLAHWNHTIFSSITYKIILYSIYIASLATIFSFILALYLLIEPSNKGNFWLMLPLTLPPVSVGFIFLQLFSGNGFVARIFQKFSFIEKAIPIDLSAHNPNGFVIILSLSFMMFPIFYAFLRKVYVEEKIPQQIELAKELGSSNREAIMKISIPQLFSKSKFYLWLYFIFAVGSFEVPLMLGAQHPRMITVFIIDKIQKFDLSTIPQGYAVVVLYLVIIISISKRFLNFVK